MEFNMIVKMVTISIILINSKSCSSQSHFALNLVHTMGLFSNYEPFDTNIELCETEIQNCFGGINRIAGFVKKFREENENVLLLDGGNVLEKSLWYRLYGGVEASEFMRLLGYNAMVLGCKDFLSYDHFIENVSFPILFSNLNTHLTNNSKMDLVRTEPLILTFGATRIGIIGFLKECNEFQAINIVVHGRQILEEIINALRTEGVKIIILISHDTLHMNKEISQAYPDIDLVIGGQSGFLYSGSPPDADKADGIYPFEIKNSHSTNLIAHSGLYGKYIGVLKLKFTSHGQILYWKGNPVLMDRHILTDPEFDVYYRNLIASIKENYYQIIGQSVELLSASNCFDRECLIGSLLCDAIVDQSLSLGSQCQSCAIYSSVIRKSLQKGSISLHKVITAFPYNVPIDAVTMGGATLWKMLEFSIKNYDLAEKDGRFLQLSGIKVKYNFKSPRYLEQVLMSLCHGCKTYKTVSNHKQYCVLLSSEALRGAEGYDWLTGEIISRTRLNMTESSAVIRYFKRYSPVFVQLRNRISGLETFPSFKNTTKNKQRKLKWIDSTPTSIDRMPYARKHYNL